MLVHSMKIFIFFFLFQLVNSCSNVNEASQPCEHPSYPPSSKLALDTFKIDLDAAPEVRYQELLAAKGDGVKALMAKFIEMLKDFKLGFVINSVNKYLPKLQQKLPVEYMREMQGISTTLKMPLGEVMLYNIFYELFTVCTSIVTTDANGHKLHARNLDFGLLPMWNFKNDSWIITEALRPIVVNLHYMKNGQVLFKAVNFAGYVGLITAVKPGMFSLSVNERFNVDGGYLGIIDWLLFHPEDQWVGFFTRQLFEKEISYSTVKQMIQNERLIAPAYFILADGSLNSTNACVITRARTETKDIRELGGSNWYLLQTNYDPWTNAPFFDNRRDPGNKCMISMGHKVMSFKTLFQVLSTRPVRNKLTVYTALMNVNTGDLESYLQYCPDPCFPW